MRFVEIESKFTHFCDVNPYMVQLKNISWYYWLYLVVVLSIWCWYMLSHDMLYILSQNIPVMVIMVFGSFIAGSSPEGSASIAYPVFTLYLGIAPDVARNFAFAIQSIGMTSASIFIINKKIKVDWNYIKYVTIGGIIGLVFGTYWIVPLVKPIIAKLIFVSLWLSFGIILYIENKNDKRIVSDIIKNFRQRDRYFLLILGFIGGIISSLFGTGINIFTFCFLVIYYGVNEKVATPSSIIIMTIETIIGFALHALVMQDFSEKSYHMWLSCIPIVVFFAPLGTYMMSKLSHKTFSNFLYFIFLIQYIGAIIVIKPGMAYSVLSLAIILIGITTFRWLALVRIKRDA